MPKNPLQAGLLQFQSDGAAADPPIEGGINYNGTNFRMNVNGTVYSIPTSSGAATAYNAIGDAAASGSIQFAAYTGTYTSTTANWGGLIFANTHANPTAGASLLNLDYTANGDAHGVFIDCTDTAGTASQFLVGADGNTVITGTATGTDALTLTAGDITLTDGDLTLDTGTVTLTAGGLDVATDNVNITLGASGATDSKIYFDGAGNLTFYDSTSGTVTLAECLSTLGPDPTVTGDLTITDGKFIWTDSVDEVAGTWSFTGATNNDITWTSSCTTANCLDITADAITSGSMIHLDTTLAGFTGEYIRCFDGAAEDFSIKVDGVTQIAGPGGGTDAFIIDTGDIFLSDSDENVIESENGTATLLLLDNKAGAVASGKSVLEVNAGGVVDAGGFGLSVLLTGASAAGATGQRIVVDAGSKGLFVNCGGVDTTEALHVDADPTANDVVLFHSDEVIAADKGILSLTHGTAAIAAGGAMLRITQAFACDADSRSIEIDNQHDARALFIDNNAVTNHACEITHSGNLAASKAVFKVDDLGVPAADNVYVGHFQFAGTDTAESVVLFADGGGKDVVGLLIDVDPVYDAAGLAGHLTMYSDAAGDLPVIMSMIHEDAGAVSGEYCSKMFFYGSDDTPARELYASIEVEMDDTANADPDGIVWIKGDLAGTNTVSAGFTGNKMTMGAAASTITTAGTWDLTISTNETAAGEPRIVFEDSNAGNITITPGTTSGQIDFALPVLHSSTETITAGTGGALSLMTSVSLLETDVGGDAYSLAAGTAGQIKFICMITDGGGAAVITLTGNAAGYDEITMEDIGDSAMVVYTATGWMPISLQGCVIA